MFCGINYKHIDIHRTNFAISRLCMLKLILIYCSSINYEILCDSKKKFGKKSCSEISYRAHRYQYVS